VEPEQAPNYQYFFDTCGCGDYPPIEILDLLIYRVKNDEPNDLVQPRLIPVAEWLMKHRGLSPEEIKRVALDETLFELAQHFGATGAEIEKAQIDHQAYEFLKRNLQRQEPTDEIIHQVLHYLEELRTQHNHTFQFSYSDLYANFLELVADQLTVWTAWKPLISYLVTVLDPRQGQDQGRDTAVSLARDPAMAAYMLHAFTPE